MFKALAGILVLAALMLSCANANKNEPQIMQYKYTNALINESSPYLLQHAHNPVNWHAWNDKTLEIAQAENKPLLISVGYAACHWCHVMEHESFEDEKIAELMNTHFICVKVDREERPDIDQVYMDAVQLMTGHGGWPLNCFALPNGQPFYGGTYFNPDQWTTVLKNIADVYSAEPQKVVEYAAQLTEGIKQLDLIAPPVKEDLLIKDRLSAAVKTLEKYFDKADGGYLRPPKFPMPNNYAFMLAYGKIEQASALTKHVELTLNKMAMGGIYDQVGGGFSRYSVDGIWKVPHFEKMLYDNAQLISLYANAFKATKNSMYMRVMEEIIRFSNRELLDAEANAYYSALDADSDGEEGKFYIWTLEALKLCLSASEFAFFEQCFFTNQHAEWENHLIIMQRENDEQLAQKLNMSLAEFQNQLESLKTKLLKEREKRNRPATDDKIICSWNALMVIGLVDAYHATAKPEYLKMATKSFGFIQQKLKKEDGGLNRIWKGNQSSINAFLDDYAFTIQAGIKLYSATFDTRYLDIAKELTDYCLNHFMNLDAPMLYYTSDLDKALVTRKVEVQDNVIPASNSQMAINLFELGRLYQNASYQKMSENMLHYALAQMVQYPTSYSNWSMLALMNSAPFYDIAIVGEDAVELSRQLQSQYAPNAVFLGSTSNENLPLLKFKKQEGRTLIYVCVDQTCKLPTSKVENALQQISY